MRPWSRLAGIVLSIISLLSFPNALRGGQHHTGVISAIEGAR
jgi:hypothetical protein